MRLAQVSPNRVSVDVMLMVQSWASPQMCSSSSSRSS
eukprot:CAMPEP_0202386430 /NCGR_PEP_ID=MMETSP1127-20130417/66393_1 /ASSEMBLY_ACC=CAM_ASM_000462 /TAXON_ID=3047 /ORGANISM="Dunaliella tertiolecta, Strain CCMP1320" /LENGTH=36 /DNA_ID= /DNA_START= /DNA_END= /DNA_ORIENTATION=